LLTHQQPAPEDGFTLVELVVALAITFLVVVYTLSTFTYQHKTYIAVDQVSETQQNSRAIATLIERDIRNAGYQVPSPAATCGVDADDAGDTLYLSDADAIQPVDQLGSSQAGRDLGASVSSITSGNPDVVRVDDLVIDGQPTYDTNGDGNFDSDFQVNGGAILVDVNNAGRGVRCGTISAVSLSAPQSVSVELRNAFGAAATLPEDLRLVPANAYSLTGGTPAQLRRNGELMARDVEDLQVAWFYDDDGDGQEDAGEYRGTATTDYDPSLVNGNDLREIRFNLVLRTRADDPRNPGAAGTGQQLENRDTNVAGDDGRRRRLHTATVRVRNIPAN